MRSRRLALPPSLRMDAQLEMLTQEVLRYLLLVRYLYCGTTSERYTYTLSTGPPHDGTRQQDQVGWSEGGPHIVIRQYTFVISSRERLLTLKIEINNFPNSEFIIVVLQLYQLWSA